MRLIDRIFNMLDCEAITDNLFETTEVIGKHEAFICKCTDVNSETDAEVLIDMFLEAIAAERAQSFKVGYETAVKLLVSGIGE